MINVKALFLIFLFASSSAFASRHLEVEYAHSDLTNNLGSWDDINIRNYLDQVTGGDTFVIETDHKNHFNQNAWLIGGTLTHVYTDAWYQDLSLTFASNRTILPGFVAFTEIHRKVLPDQSLVLGLGAGYVSSASPYSDTYGLAEATYYLSSLFSIQGGMRINQSNPGSVVTARFFGIFTLLHQEHWEGFVRFETGKEGYTLISSNSFRNEFGSSNESAQVQYWFDSKYGAGLNLDLYQSDFYRRNGGALMFLMKY